MNSGKALLIYADVLPLAATSGAAGSRTAPSAGADRLDRGDTETGAWTGVDIIDGNSTSGGQ